MWLFTFGARERERKKGIIGRVVRAAGGGFESGYTLYLAIESDYRCRERESNVRMEVSGVVAGDFRSVWSN